MWLDGRLYTSILAPVQVKLADLSVTLKLIGSAAMRKCRGAVNVAYHPHVSRAQPALPATPRPTDPAAPYSQTFRNARRPPFARAFHRSLAMPSR
jgi:hypothetical protein